MEQTVIKLDLNDIDDRAIHAAFDDVNGLECAITMLALKYSAAQKNAWAKAKRKFPQLKGASSAYDTEKHEFIIKGDLVPDA